MKDGSGEECERGKDKRRDARGMRVKTRWTGWDEAERHGPRKETQRKCPKTRSQTFQNISYLFTCLEIEIQ